jgi:MFS family permease
MLVFLLARGAYWQLTIAMTADGFGVGCVYAVNPLQITAGVPPDQTGSAMSFYQLNRTVAYSLASAVSALLLVLSTPRGHALPADAGYTNAALTSTAILTAALAVSVLFAVRAGRSGSRPAAPPGQPGQHPVPAQAACG